MPKFYGGEELDFFDLDLSFEEDAALTSAKELENWVSCAAVFTLK